MLRKTVYPLLFVLVAAVGFASPRRMARADSGAASYQFLIGVGFLIGPDEAAAPDGMRLEMTGAGEFTIHPKEAAAGGGMYDIKDASGNLLQEGTWAVTRFMSFVSYGSFPAPFPPSFEGGQALFEIHLTPSTGGAGVDGVLKVTCVGGSPPGGKDEGVQLALRGGPNFNRNFGEEAGQTLFIRQ